MEGLYHAEQPKYTEEEPADTVASQAEMERRAPGIYDVLLWANSKGVKASDVHVVEGDIYPWIRRGETLSRKADARPIGPQEVAAMLQLIGKQDESIMIQMDTARWRITIFPAFDGTRLACRRIPNHPPPLDQLGISLQIRQLSSKKKGLLIASGSAGSGKTTTLAALVNTINITRRCHILTIEDPIEYIYPPGRALVAQREISKESNAYTRALEVALRSDINVVLLGECIEPEQFVECMKLAATGHLVLTSMHATDCATTCQRIISMTGESGQSMLAQTLIGIISQRLIPSKDDPRRRHWVAETLINNFVYEKLIAPGDSHDIRKIHQQLEIEQRSLDQELARLVRRGLIKKEDALAEAKDVEQFTAYVDE